MKLTSRMIEAVGRLKFMASKWITLAIQIYNEYFLKANSDQCCLGVLRH